MLSKVLTAAILLAACVSGSADITRPDCAATVNVTTEEPTTLGFDDVTIQPCVPRRSLLPYSGLIFTNSSGLPAPVHNTSSTPTCHTSSSGSGPFGMDTSQPNSVEAEGGVLNVQAVNGSSFSFLSVRLIPKFYRIPYQNDEDPLVIGRANGYDACGNLVAVDTQAFYEMKRGHGPYYWNVTEPERWTNLQRVELLTWWWYQKTYNDDGTHAGGTPTFATWYTYFDDFTYLTDATSNTRASA